ncbi:unnamed protein product [Aduncisulcus paluster]|uniref:Unnamed protein product n=1 Tax=Aduncisulcus paluster TaxID=2918883 RepID=A0ABQ5KQY4_9EUKA|nr:unnamed protein product [Aduncisulcus paluster]
MSIPTRTPLGYNFLGDVSSEIIMELYLDPECPDSADIWNDIIIYLDSYFTDAQLAIYYHLFPLPYHMFSYDMSLAVESAWNLEDNSSVFFSFIYDFFNDQSQWDNDSTANTPRSTIQEDIANYVSSTLDDDDISANEVLTQMRSSNMDEHLREFWKYGCEHGVSGTPTVMINGVEFVDWMYSDSEWTVSDWVTFIRSLLV